MQGLSILSAELAGCVPVFPGEIGDTLAQSAELETLRRRQIIFGRINQPGRVHVYSAECTAGERLRIQLLAPKLPFGRGLAPCFAVVAQSLPYSADTQKLPFDLPAGYSAVVAPAPGALSAPTRDPLTRTEYYTGPLIDTRTLVGGRCYIVVWSPTGQMGKYALRVGWAWPWRFAYWLRLPFFWWQIRGWFGVSRGELWITLTLAILFIGLALRGARKGTRPSRATAPRPDESISPPTQPKGENRADHSLSG